MTAGTLLPVVVMLAGAGVGFGILLVIAGLRGTRVLPGGRRTGGDGSWPAEWADGDGGPRQVGPGVAPPSQHARRWMLASGAGFVVWLLSGWPAVGILVAVAGGMAPYLFGGGAARKAWIVKTQAIASWTEMLRDTMAAADGVEEAIAATVPIAPPAIRSEVAILDARRRSEQPLAEALAAFGAEVDHPSCDLVVASLSAAAQGEGSDFVAVLTRLSEMTRDEVRMRLRVEASQAKMHTSSRIILAVIGVAMLLLVLAGRGYLEAYDSPAGQVWLLLVGAVLALGLYLLNRTSRIRMPERFSPRSRGGDGVRQPGVTG